ncbi:MAG TPA: anti-sigma factor [Dehalococcoidia bacterium]|nr:anti-sigma factor [Dehalococcoidia bacterium]
MDCSEVEELAGAIALRALPAEEERAVEEHLATCDQDHSDLTALGRVVTLLPFAVEEVEPPAHLKANLLAALANDPGGAAGLPRAGAAAGSELPRLNAVPPAGVMAAPSEPLPLRPPAVRTRRLWQQPGIWAAAAAVLIAIGMGAWNVSLQQRLSDRNAASARQARALTALASAVHVVPLSGSGGLQAAFAAAPDGSGSLVLTGAHPAPPGKVYQAWFIRAGQNPVSAGVFNADGVAVVPLQGSAAGAQTVAVTVEPPGGSPQPTSQPIEVGTIGS